ncbi:MAG: DUF1648 domain-containing protein [Verrucomicrobiales bacterium]|jgi:uncharacterized membrane protein|nr:DUF1648 domain-containing protein [Verrucomicrobiales bacterium]
MNSRPRIKILLTRTDWLLETVAWLLFVLFLTLVFIKYSNLPKQLPVHFNMQGLPDAYGSRKHLFHSAVLGSLLFLLLSVITHFPHRFNYAVAITETNAGRQYFLAVRLIRALKPLIAADFLVIALTMTGLVKGLGNYFSSITILAAAAMLGTVAVYLYFSFKARD